MGDVLNNQIIVTVDSIPTLDAQVNITGQTIVSNDPITLISDSGNSQNRLDGLVDVYEGGDPEDGSTLVYDKTNDKYIVRKLPVGDIDGNFDGGSF